MECPFHHERFRKLHVYFQTPHLLFPIYMHSICKINTKKEYKYKLNSRKSPLSTQMIVSSVSWNGCLTNICLLKQWNWKFIATFHSNRSMPAEPQKSLHPLFPTYYPMASPKIPLLNQKPNKRNPPYKQKQIWQQYRRLRKWQIFAITGDILSLQAIFSRQIVRK